MLVAKEKKYTSEDFFNMFPESNHERYELIEGEVIALAAPSQLHQEIVVEVLSEIRNFIKKNKGNCKPLVAPFDVRLDSRNVVQPDILVVCDPNKLSDGKRCNGAPDMVIEVTSTDSKRDFIDKLYTYRNAGVREYWVVDVQNKKVLVYFFDISDFPDTYKFEQDIPVGIFDNELKINIAGLL